MDRDEILDDAVRQIEDVFAQHHAGGRLGRVQAIAAILRRTIIAMKEAPNSKERSNSPPQADVRGKDGTFDKPFNDYLKE